MMSAIEKAGYKGKVKLGMDAAATEFFKDGDYHIDGKSLSRNKLVQYYAGIAKDYPVIVLEDPFAEEDWEGFVAITGEGGKDVAVTLGAQIIKTGAPARSERTSKYNQLLRIEERLGKAAVYTEL